MFNYFSQSISFGFFFFTITSRKEHPLFNSPFKNHNRKLLFPVRKLKPELSFHHCATVYLLDCHTFTTSLNWSSRLCISLWMTCSASASKPFTPPAQVSLYSSMYFLQEKTQDEKLHQALQWYLWYLRSLILHKYIFYKYIFFFILCLDIKWKTYGHECWICACKQYLKKLKLAPTRLWIIFPSLAFIDLFCFLGFCFK